MVAKEIETGDKKNPIGPNGAAADEDEFMMAVAEAGGDDYEDADEDGSSTPRRPTSCP